MQAGRRPAEARMIFFTISSSVLFDLSRAIKNSLNETKWRGWIKWSVRVPPLDSVPGALYPLPASQLWAPCDIGLTIPILWGRWDSWGDGVSQPGPHSDKEAAGMTPRPRATSLPHPLLSHSHLCSQSLGKLEIYPRPHYIYTLWKTHSLIKNRDRRKLL